MAPQSIRANVGANDIGRGEMIWALATGLGIPGRRLEASSGRRDWCLEACRRSASFGGHTGRGSGEIAGGFMWNVAADWGRVRKRAVQHRYL